MANNSKEKENSNTIDTTHITENADIVPEIDDIDSSIEDLSNNPVIIWV